MSVLSRVACNLYHSYDFCIFIQSIKYLHTYNALTVKSECCGCIPFRLIKKIKAKTILVFLYLDVFTYIQTWQLSGVFCSSTHIGVTVS